MNRTTIKQLTSSGWLLSLILVSLLGPENASAQEKNSRGQAGTRQSASENSDRRAIARYADAAGFQNNAAYPLAIEEWQKLLKEFPKDPLASKAWHYLGVCYIQVEQPDYDKAIEAFEMALRDKQLELREESSINLSWCLFNKARSAQEGSSEQRRGLQKAQQSMEQFLTDHSDGGYVDQALFYLGEIHYALGDKQDAVKRYQQMLNSRSLAKSSLRPNARYALAVAFEDLNDRAKASREYQTFLRDHPDHALQNEVRVRLADLLLANNQAADAQQLLADVSLDSNDMADYTLLRLGYALSQQGQNEAATTKYQELLEKFPESKHARTAALSVGQSLFGAGRYPEAIEMFQKVVKAEDDQAIDAAHWIAITLLRQNKAEEASAFVEQALTWAQGKAGEINLQMDWADALYMQPNQLEKARAEYEKIATEHPENPLAPRAAYNAAFAALQLGIHQDARQWAEKFLQKYPQDPLRNDVAYVAAEALLQAGEHKAASQAYAKLRQADPQNPAQPLWALRQAMAHYLSADYQAAIQLVTEKSSSFKADNQRAEAQYILGASHLYLEQTDQAIQQLKASHTTSDRWNSADEVLLMLAEAYQRAKDNQKAKDTLETLLKKYPNTRLKAQVEYKLGQLSAAMDLFDEAIKRYRTIVQNPEAKPFHEFAQYGIVWCLMQQEQYQPALEQLQPLLRQPTQNSIGSEAQLAHGICLRKLGQTESAVTALQAFLDSQPTGLSLANGRYELGLALTELKRPLEANQQFKSLAQESPSYRALDRALYELAWNAQDAGQTDEAIATFARLAQEFPDSEFAGEATYMLAQEQYDSAQFSQAVAMYTSVLSRTQDPQLLEKTLYKLGWSLYQQEAYPQAADKFNNQAKQYPTGPLAVDALFMAAECSFKQENFETALLGYRAARRALENPNSQTSASDQIKTLVYLHGAQALREQEAWPESQEWLETIIRNYPRSPYLDVTLYELGFCKQKQNKIVEALAHYSEVAENYRNEVAARSRFMMGEVYFEQRDFAKAIPQFQRVMYGFGGDKAPAEIKNWQVRSAYEAARCSEVLIQNLQGPSRDKVVQSAQDYYRFIVENHAAHDLAAQARNRLGELQKLR